MLTFSGFNLGGGQRSVFFLDLISSIFPTEVTRRSGRDKAHPAAQTSVAVSSYIDSPSRRLCPRTPDGSIARTDGRVREAEWVCQGDGQAGALQRWPAVTEASLNKAQKRLWCDGQQALSGN